MAMGMRHGREKPLMLLVFTATVTYVWLCLLRFHIGNLRSVQFLARVLWMPKGKKLFSLRGKSLETDFWSPDVQGDLTQPKNRQKHEWGFGRGKQCDFHIARNDPQSPSYKTLRIVLRKACARVFFLNGSRKPTRTQKRVWLHQFKFWNISKLLILHNVLPCNFCIHQKRGRIFHIEKY